MQYKNRYTDKAKQNAYIVIVYILDLERFFGMIVDVMMIQYGIKQ